MSFNVLLIGAGEINFGSVEGPWNHTLRLERKLGSALRVVGLIDPDQARAIAALKSKQDSDVAPCYADCRIIPTISEASLILKDDLVPRLAIVGAPPFARGSDERGKDLELQLVSAYPGCALFVEKPVSSGLVDACWRVAATLRQCQTLVGVGYMLRYSKAVQKMKQIISENDLVVMGTNARYVMAYEHASKLSWWNKDSSGGPIVEQATHFCDLSRYFGGDIHLPSVSAHIVEHHELPGKLSATRFDEFLVPIDKRLPRLTSATWKYKGGAVGALTHVIGLHGTMYDTEFEVYADGHRLKLVDPYGTSPILSVRKPGVVGEELYTFADDDPFYTELSTMIDVTQNPMIHESLLSSYEDAVKTYEFTWQIRLAGEISARCFHAEMQS